MWRSLGLKKIIPDIAADILSVAPAELSKNYKNLTENKNFFDGGEGGGWLGTQELFP